MEQKPGWTYTFIPTLNQYIAINDKTGVMYTQDKTPYTKEEQELLKKVDYQIPPQVHILKKMFNGTIVDC